MAIIKEPFLRVIRKTESAYKPGIFKLETPMTFVWDEKAAVITVDAGLFTNFASIPLGLRNIYSINGDHRLPAIIHDFLYERLGTVLAESLVDEKGNLIKLDSPKIIRYTRLEADNLFYKLMIEEGVSGFTAASMFRAVRAFGYLYAREWKS